MAGSRWRWSRLVLLYGVGIVVQRQARHVKDQDIHVSKRLYTPPMTTIPMMMTPMMMALNMIMFPKVTWPSDDWEDAPKEPSC